MSRSRYQGVVHGPWRGAAAPKCLDVGEVPHAEPQVICRPSPRLILEARRALNRRAQRLPARTLVVHTPWSEHVNHQTTSAKVDQSNCAGRRRCGTARLLNRAPAQKKENRRGNTSYHHHPHGPAAHQDHAHDPDHSVPLGLPEDVRPQSGGGRLRPSCSGQAKNAAQSSSAIETPSSLRSCMVIAPTNAVAIQSDSRSASACGGRPMPIRSS